MLVCEVLLYSEACSCVGAGQTNKVMLSCGGRYGILQLAKNIEK